MALKALHEEENIIPVETYPQESLGLAVKRGQGDIAPGLGPPSLTDRGDYSAKFWLSS